MNAAETLMGSGTEYEDDAYELCASAIGAPFLSEADDAIASYPGRVSLEADWAGVKVGADHLFEACASLSTSSFLDAQSRFIDADLQFSLGIVDALAEADGRIDPESDRVARYDEIREGARRSKELELMTIASEQNS